MSKPKEPEQLPVQEKLIKAATACFLDDEYHKVTTRQIAAQADTNVSMIRYFPRQWTLLKM